MPTSQRSASPASPGHARRRSSASHRRHPSSLDLSRITPQRRSSKSSFQYSPITPRSGHGMRDSMTFDTLDTTGDGDRARTGSVVAEMGGGMESLADELGEFGDEGWSGEDEDELDLDDLTQSGILEEPVEASMGSQDHEMTDASNMLEGDGNDGAQNAEPKPPGGLLKPSTSSINRRAAAYDGSEYGSASESDGGVPYLISRDLERVIQEVCTLATVGHPLMATSNIAGLKDSGPVDEVIPRVVAQLQNLGSQASVETAVVRLLTTHAALTSHITHQTRTVASLTSSILSPLTVSMLTPEILDELTGIIPELIRAIPNPFPLTVQENPDPNGIPPVPQSPLISLHNLSRSTDSLLGDLSHLSDQLFMSRQTSLTATRRLAAARQLVAQIREEADLGEEGVRWIESGKWDEKLSRRWAEGEVRGVVGGFEQVCEGMRSRLEAQVAV
ncbi:hypothetical protein P152DRAFT_248659 [Eremomyces bilateralis CBS 781.70]|uniref:Uncharacterized protein n=1 Tax=Eremomyces bilateralis CBS 781.70 TaxID=1392243 RepID=A0A6G1GAZ3_9PEZI|nr:uncharacterized protein P152DRAFT_248659 [Eremomyces bilateralis CBS 781.70]KAF1815203.1 hypothetical protein P152DRAFT_248659 [Eremomyces bilateralis CBS 781.70]